MQKGFAVYNNPDFQLHRPNRLYGGIQSEPAQGDKTSVPVYRKDAVGEERNEIWRSRLRPQRLHLSPRFSGVSREWGLR